MRKQSVSRRGMSKPNSERQNVLALAVQAGVGGSQRPRQSALATAIQKCAATSHNQRRRVLAVSAAAVGLQLTTIGTLAFAQTGLEGDEIIVTATRREQTVQEIPFNISAVSGKALEEANIIDSVDALRSVAGISVYDRGYRTSGVTNGIVIRGVNVDSGTNGDVPLAAPPTVQTYIDNTAGFGNFVLKDIERIEVLRGPQGTLYGSGSLAGNVRYILNKPDLEGFSGKASFSYGQTDGSDGDNLNPDLMLNIPLGSTLALRLNAGQVKNDGIVDYPNIYALDANGDPVVNGDVETALPVYTGVKDVDSVDIKYYRVSALYRPIEDFSAQLSYQRQDDEIGGRRQVTSGDNLTPIGGTYGDYDFGAVQLEPSSREASLMALEMEVGLGFATLTSSTSYYDHSGSGISDNSGVYAQNGWFAYYGSSPRPIAQAQRFFDENAWTQELRLVSEGENFIDWTAGAFYTDQDYDLGQDSYLPGYIPFLNAIDLYGLAPFTTNQDFLFRRNQTYKELAGFGEVTFNVRDDLHLTVGGRYYDNSLDVHAMLDVPIYSSPSNPPGVADETIDDRGFLAKANVAWDVTDDSMVYLTFSQGYRHAGANSVPTSGKYAENPAYLTFKSDTLNNYELGYKGTYGGQAYSASVYYEDWQDPQLNTSTPNWGFFAVVNGDSARTTGIELELSGQVVENLSYTVGYTYANAELTSDVIVPSGNFAGTGPLTTRLIAEDGDRLPGSPENILNASLTYVFNLSSGMDLTSVLSGYFQSDIVNALGSDVIGDPIYSRAAADIDGFTLWNLSTTLSKDAWGVSLFVKNLFNDEGSTGTFTPALGGPETDPSQNYYGNNSRDYIALPRTIGVALSYSF